MSDDTLLTADPGSSSIKLGPFALEPAGSRATDRGADPVGLAFSHSDYPISVGELRHADRYPPRGHQDPERNLFITPCEGTSVPQPKSVS